MTRADLIRLARERGAETEEEAAAAVDRMIAGQVAAHRRFTDAMDAYEQMIIRKCAKLLTAAEKDK